MTNKQIRLKFFISGFTADHWEIGTFSYPFHACTGTLASLPPVGILNLLCLICTIFICYAHFKIFTWNLRDINVCIIIIIIMIIMIMMMMIIIVTIIIIITIIITIIIITT